MAKPRTTGKIKYANSWEIRIPSVEHLIGRNISWSYGKENPEWTPDLGIQGMFLFDDYEGIITAIDEHSVSVKLADETIHGLITGGFTHIAQKDIDDAITDYYIALHKRDKLKAREEDQTEYAIYGLVDPIDKSVFYVGASVDVQKRYEQHLKLEGTNKAKNQRIAQIQRRGLTPQLVILEIIIGRLNALKGERRWMQTFAKRGTKLTNIDLMEVEE